MSISKLFMAALAATVLAGPTIAQTPPKAEKRPHQVTAPGGVREDEYYWLRDDKRKDPAMLDYLKAENAYADAVMARTKPLQDTLFKEIVGRVKQDDASAPYRLRGYWYYTRFETGKDYPVWARRKGEMTAPEEIMLDQSAMAAGKAFFQIRDAVISQDNRYIAWIEDSVGRRQFTLKIRDLTTGEVLPDAVANVDRSIIWANGNTVLYIEKDPVTLLAKRVKAHVLGTPASADKLLYAEADDSFYMALQRTKSDRFVCVMLQSTVASEQRCAPADNPEAEGFKVFMPRMRDHLYQADNLGGRWVIRTNWDAPNYRMMTLADGQPLGNRAAWKTLVAHRKDAFIDSFAVFDSFLAINERSDGLRRMRILRKDGRSDYAPADEPAYQMVLNINPEAATTRLRYAYTSQVTPMTIYELDTATGQRTTIKETPVVGYDRSQYVTERVWVPARDGVKVPVSVVYRKGFKKDGSAALLQHGYGSYGISSDPIFSVPLISLLDRGMVYAVAHIRGGQEMGRGWYDAGRLMTKQNTFNDFIDVTRYLVAQKYAAKDRVAATGESAGGLLMGGIANMAPDDYRALVAQVPFVDVVTTMLDESIPLTTNEFDEWGNPKAKAAYDYMLSYSPYDNVGAHRYPAMFVATGLFDSQVQYFEPAKWVARLRDRKTGDEPLVFRVNLEAGHGGRSGRFGRFAETAEQYAFVLDQLGVK